ncbi:MAG: hypothetical protein H6735_33825 [Alphaproteobacteria bacterium]|nr:hypothetical protein [Alphaproteobacteria bacterium]
MDVRRRTLLGAALMALTTPGWLGAAFASTSTSTVSELLAAYRRAQQAGRPLLVLVIPEAIEHRYDHGALLGALLNHGDDAVLAALALPEVVCALPSQLAELVPDLTVPADAWAVVVETDAVPARTTVVAGTPPEGARATDGDWAAIEAAEDRALQARMDWLSGQLIGRLQQDRATLARRVAQQRAADAVAVDAVSSALASGIPTVARASLAPSVVALAAADAKPEDRVPLVALLADVTRAALVQRPVPGSAWAVSSGCGTHIEGVTEQVMVKCGMGHVTARARRALHFWDQEAM